MLATITLLAFGATLQGPPQRNPAFAQSPAQRCCSTDLVAAAAPDMPPIAENLGDVVGTTAGSFFTIGGLGFVFTLFSEGSKRANTGGKARAMMPYFVMRAAVLQGQRWGRVSAGFAGGRALGQVIRGVDGSACAMYGAVFGGIAAAPSVAAIPSSVASFAAFTYFIESFSGGSSAASSEQKQKQLLEDELARHARLQLQLMESERKISQLKAA